MKDVLNTELPKFNDLVQSKGAQPVIMKKNP